MNEVRGQVKMAPSSWLPLREWSQFTYCAGLWKADRKPQEEEAAEAREELLTREHRVSCLELSHARKIKTFTKKTKKKQTYCTHNSASVSPLI